MQRDSQTHEAGWRLAAGRGATGLQRRAVSPWRSESKHADIWRAALCLSGQVLGRAEGMRVAYEQSHRTRRVLTGAACACSCRVQSHVGAESSHGFKVVVGCC